jgi:hypothetical protein
MRLLFMPCMLENWKVFGFYHKPKNEQRSYDLVYRTRPKK